MEKQKHIELLQNELNTDSLVVKFVADLFTGLEFKYLHTYPDQIEKDGIILYRQDTLEDEPLWTGCIVRNGNIGGSTGTPARNKTASIIESVRYVLEKDFIIDRTTKIKVDRILIISNGINSKNSQLKIKLAYSSAVIIFWDVNKLYELTLKHWPKYFDTKEPLLKEYCQALKMSLEDISKELHVLYYNKKVKKLWDIFINLQLVETKIVASNSTISAFNQIASRTKKDIYVEDNNIQIKTLFKQKFKIEEIIETGKHSIIVGDFGSGKTTILKRIAFEIIDKSEFKDQFKFPVFLLARNLTYHHFDIELYTEFEINFLTKGKSVNYKEYLESGRIIILIDGLDDIIDGDKEKFIESLNVLKDKFPRVQFILATRPILLLEKEKIFEDFRKFEIQPLEFSQIAELIDKWYPTDQQQKGKLLNVLKKTSLIVSISKTPLAITLLTIIFEDEDKVDEIPANITELYNKFTEVFSGRWDREKGISSQDKYGIRSHLINQVAFFMHFNKKVELSESDLYDFVDNYKNDKRYDDIDTIDLIHDFLNRNPLITMDNDRYKFLHLSFQEYYASRGIQQTNEYVQDHKDFLVEKYLDPWWSNVILFYVGNVKDCPQFLVEVTEKTVAITLDQKYLKIDNTGKILQAAISTDNGPKVKALERILLTVDHFRDGIINELKKDEDLNLFFRRNGLSEMYIIVLMKEIFISTYKSKYLRPVMTDIFDKMEISKISDLSKYLLANSLTDISGDPSYMLRFISSTGSNLEWRYLGLIDLEKKKFKLDKIQKKSVGAVKRKLMKGKKYIIARFKKLKEIPKLKEKIDKENLLSK
ncbi:MAG: NACHT domain-containing protein [Ignavibacteriales bacterium]|nr:NACHT domain-containing protein [Ignavibacteriales bacterium]